MTDLSKLNAHFGVPGHIRFTEREAGLAIAEIDNPHGSAHIALQGAHLLDWTPRGQAPVFWLSAGARFALGKAIRGGIPVCWPWFGPHDVEPSFPSHGIARTQAWEVIHSGNLPDGRSELRLRLNQSEETRGLWPHQTPLELHFSVGDDLRLTLTTRNLTPSPVTIGSALHAYLAVGDVRSIRLQGLDGRPYIDSLDAGRRKWQSGPVQITGETDRIYLETAETCIVEDPRMGRRIQIAKSGSQSTVVWNPWIEKSERLGDMGPEGYLNMLCVESANAADDCVTVDPGGEHRLCVTYSVHPTSGLGIAI